MKAIDILEGHGVSIREGVFPGKAAANPCLIEVHSIVPRPSLEALYLPAGSVCAASTEHFPIESPVV